MVCECQSYETVNNGERLKSRPNDCNCQSRKITKKDGWEINETSYVYEEEISELDSQDKDVRTIGKLFINIDRLSGRYLKEYSSISNKVSTDKVVDTYKTREIGQCKKVDGPSL